MDIAKITIFVDFLTIQEFEGCCFQGIILGHIGQRFGSGGVQLSRSGHIGQRVGSLFLDWKRSCWEGILFKSGGERELWLRMFFSSCHVWSGWWSGIKEFSIIPIWCIQSNSTLDGPNNFFFRFSSLLFNKIWGYYREAQKRVWLNLI